MPLQSTRFNNPSALALAKAISAGWKPACHITYSRDAWVKLLQPPIELGFDEAKLLCQDAPNTWVAWVPEYGEMRLDRSDFYC